MILSGDERVLGWGCSKCKGEEFEEGDELRAIRNCDSSQNKNISWDWMPSLRRCPWSQIDEETWMVIGWWVEWREFKVLPFEGSDLLEQPAYVIEVFSFLGQLKSEVERKVAEREKKELEKQQRAASRKRGR